MSAVEDQDVKLTSIETEMKQKIKKTSTAG
jgi:hypothetical protein